jgi:hypothetical protein
MGKPHHPWWTHLPAVGCVAAAGVLLANFAPQGPVPVHFGLDGRADRWGSVIELWLALVGVPLGIIIGSAFLDEVYARTEDRKRFNWLSLLDEGVVGFFLGMTIHVAPQLAAREPELKGFFIPSLTLAAAAMAAAAVLERMRPHHPAPPPSSPTALSELSPTLRRAIAEGADWRHEETQNPWWVSVAVIGASLAMAIGAVVFYILSPWLTLLLAIPAVAMVAFYGGLRITVDADRLVVSLGLGNIPLRKLPLDQIASVAVVNFSPLADFGGWGIRYSWRKRTWGYFLRGRVGVRIETVKGKRYLLGSDEPERLAAICQSALDARK